MFQEVFLAAGRTLELMETKEIEQLLATVLDVRKTGLIKTTLYALTLGNNVDTCIVVLIILVSIYRTELNRIDSFIFNYMDLFIILQIFFFFLNIKFKFMHAHNPVY